MKVSQNLAISSGGIGSLRATGWASKP
jgi:hypothetical protein